MLIPTITVLIGIFYNIAMSGRIDGRFETLEARFSERLENLEARFSGRFEGIEARLAAIEGDLRRFYQLFGEHSARIEHLEKKR